MKIRFMELALALALTITAGVACAFQHPAVMDETADGGPLRSQARRAATLNLKLIEHALENKALVACAKCKSGYALKVVEQAMQKRPALSDDQVAQVERLHAEGKSLYDEGKYHESLELSRKAQAILGIDASGDRRSGSTDGTAEAGAQ